VYQSVATRRPPPVNTRPPSFTKYIAVPAAWLQSGEAPHITHDQVDRSEWIRAQLAVERRRRQGPPGSALHRALSDPSLVSEGSSTKSDDDDDDDDDVDWTAVSPELEALCRSRRKSCTWRRTAQGIASKSNQIRPNVPSIPQPLSNRKTR